MIVSIISRTLSPYAAERFVDFLREVRVAIRHRRGIKSARMFDNARGLKVNFASGPHKKEGFLNLDSSAHGDIQLDLRRSVPLPDGSCKLVMSEHFIEHLRYPEGAELFAAECFRLLEPGGLFYASVPNAPSIINRYVEGTHEWVKKEKPYHPDEYTTGMELVNDLFRQRPRGRSIGHFECHWMAYDFETFQKLLTNAGFIGVVERPRDSGIDSSHHQGSLFIAASKP